MKTYSAKLSDVKRDWHIIDAKGLVLGRVAARIAQLLQGKHKPMFSPNLDCGDHVVVINAEEIRLTGKKTENKKYYWHTGYPGGIKETTPRRILESKHSNRVLESAVRRMLPKGPLGHQQLKKLRVYAGESHPHEAQSPTPLDFGAENRKNVA